MAVKATLEGHGSDLEKLVGLFRDGDPRVSKEDSIYYVTSVQFDGLFDDSRRLADAASRLLIHIIGISRALDASFRSVKLGGKYVESDGRGTERRRQIFQLETAYERNTAGSLKLVTDGPWQTPVPQGTVYMQLISEPDVAEVFAIFGSASTNLGWVDLYKVYEIVRHHVGGEKSLLTYPWVSKAEISAFTGSANRPDVSGDSARHARTSGRAPARTMTLTEGQEFIRNIVIAWLDSLVLS